MKANLKILLSFCMLLNFWNLSAQTTFQLSNQTPAKITLLLPLTEAEMGKPLDFAQLQSCNVLKMPLAPGSTLSVPLKWADADPRHLLAIAESAPSSFENTFTYFMIYGVKDDNVSLEESHFIGSEEPIPPAVVPLPKLIIRNKTTMPLYGLTLHWEQVDGKQECILLKPWQVIQAANELSIEPDFDPWATDFTFSLRAKLRQADGTWVVKELPLQGKMVVIE